MRNDPSRRNFLKAGLLVPAAGLVNSRTEAPLVQASPGVSYRTLGRTGLKVSSVGFGTGFNPKPDVLARAVDLGVNYFDTARNYGGSEGVVGKALQGKRDKVFIATKGGGKTKEELFKQMETSLGALGTDYVDVYLLHARDNPEGLNDDMIDAMDALKKQGKARHIGISTHDPNNVADVVVKSGKLDVVLLTYSYPIAGIYRESAIKKLHAAGVGVVAMKAVVAISGIRMMEMFAQGKGMMDLGPDFFTPKAKGEACLSAIKWVLTNPAIATAITDHNTAANLEMNVRAMTEPYTAKDERLLYAMNEQIRPFYCRMCYECRGQCRNGLPVTDTLRFLAYNDFVGNYHRARLNFAELPNEAREIRCADCASCTVRCPNGVAVRERMTRAQELLA